MWTLKFCCTQIRGCADPKEGSRGRKEQLPWVVPLNEGFRGRKGQLPWVVPLKG